MMLPIQGYSYVFWQHSNLHTQYGMPWIGCQISIHYSDSLHPSSAPWISATCFICWPEWLLQRLTHVIVIISPGLLTSSLFLASQGINTSHCLGFYLTHCSPDAYIQELDPQTNSPFFWLPDYKICDELPPPGMSEDLAPLGKYFWPSMGRC